MPSYPDYKIPQTDMDSVAAKLATQTREPECRVCMNATHDGGITHYYPSSKLPADVDSIAHHMWTR